MSVDREAAVYDEEFGPNPVRLLFRHIFQERLRRLFPPRSRVLDLGGGTGEHALFLAAAGVEVLAVDAGPWRDLDGAYSDFGALNCADLGAVGRALARALRPGAPVLLALPAREPGLREARARLGPEFDWRDAFALGVLLPGPSHAAWVERHPQAFGVLAALEGIVRRWPLLRALGDHVVIEGVRV